MRRVRIFDTTLRDGEQTPGVSLSPRQKLSIAEKLDTLGVDAIEAGFPIVSDGEREAARLITQAGLRCDVCGLARANTRDIDAVADSGLGYVHTFIATSDIHLEHKLRMTRDQMLEAAVSSVEYAKSRGLQVEFSAEDATRTDRALLRDVFGSVAKAGADRIDIPDTVGYATPQYVAEITRDAIRAAGVPVSVHCHNDFGLAVANAISGLQAGAECAHVTINGIGERAGNASLEELVMAVSCLEHAEKMETGIDSRLIYETSRFVSKTVGVTVQRNKAIVGENAFGHESGIHTHGVLSNPLTYEPISPELVGRTRWLQAGKHAGVHGLNAMLHDYGVNPSEDESREILSRIKRVGDKGDSMTDLEMLTIAEDVMDSKSQRRLVRLVEFSVTTGIGVTPHAFVKLSVDGKEVSAADEGVGPVNAALSAIQKIMGRRYEVHIKEYGLDSISGGSDALCEVTIRVEDAHGSSFSAKSVGKDIVTTSVRAVLDGINRLMLRRELAARGEGRAETA